MIISSKDYINIMAHISPDMYFSSPFGPIFRLKKKYYAKPYHEPSEIINQQPPVIINKHKSSIYGDDDYLNFLEILLGYHKANHEHENKDNNYDDMPSLESIEDIDIKENDIIEINICI